MLLSILQGSLGSWKSLDETPCPMVKNETCRQANVAQVLIQPAHSLYRRCVFWNGPHTMLCTYLLSELKEVLFWNLLTMQLTMQVGRANFHKRTTANLRKRPSVKPGCQVTGVWAKLWRHPTNLILEAETEICFDFRMTHNHRQFIWSSVPREISKPSRC